MRSLNRVLHGKCTRSYSSKPNEVYQLKIVPWSNRGLQVPAAHEDRQTYKYHASYKTIGKAVKMSTNTVRKCTLDLQVSRNTAAQHAAHTGGGRFSYEQQMQKLRKSVKEQRMQAQLSCRRAPQVPLSLLNEQQHCPHRECGRVRKRERRAQSCALSSS